MDRGHDIWFARQRCQGTATVTSVDDSISREAMLTGLVNVQGGRAALSVGVFQSIYGKMILGQSIESRKVKAGSKVMLSCL